ncbi:MAG: DUF2156 domain-containing protein [Proteobacteria bacterium]|nr:DUF2156 domain-containing protein [Pseudomonadota bacterium]
MLQFETISLDKQNAYLSYFSRCLQKTSDYSFINLWGWAEEYDLSWAWADNLVWIKQAKPEEMYWAPVGDWQSIDWKDVFAKRIGPRVKYKRVPEVLARLWQDSLGDSVEHCDDRDSWDYLYLITDLVELKGNRYHKKKNLLNQFKNKYDFEYVPFQSHMVQDALDMQENWCTWRDCESSETLSSENKVISRILHRWEKLTGITGGALLIDNKMIAYTLAEELSEETILIHFEKADPDYKGSYQAINQMFLSNLKSGHTCVNREQDLGDEGLRKAKLSYHPEDFLKKFKGITL